LRVQPLSAPYASGDNCDPEGKQLLHEVIMKSLFDSATTFFTEEEGAALAEYGVLVAFIAIVAITSVTFFGSKISAKFSQLATSFT
jgi:Flp pilus assembly pilin Flp